MVQMVLRANELLASVDDFNPGDILGLIDGQETVRGASEASGVMSVLPTDHGDALRSFLDTIPASLDAAILAALRSAVGRGLRTQLSWEPGYDFQLRVWEASAGSDGLLNIHLVSPHPIEPGREAD